MKNQINLGVVINAVVDVGASDGRWSLGVMKLFPDSRYLLIEANDFHKESLDKFVKKHKNAQYFLAAAGDKLGQCYFENTDPFGGLAQNEKTNENMIQVPAVTVDHCVSGGAEGKVNGPFLLKLDTHGFEVPIFEGAGQTLKDTEIIVVEAYNFQIANGSLQFYEMCEYMKGKGFRCVSIIDMIHRPKDNFLWQMDLIFVKSTREEFSYNRFV